MSTRAEQERKSAEGMVERSRSIAEGIGSARSKREAMSTYRTMTACVKEVHKHYRNILRAVNNEDAGHALDVLELLHECKRWREDARAELVTWAVTDDEVAQIDREVGVDAEYAELL